MRTPTCWPSTGTSWTSPSATRPRPGCTPTTLPGGCRTALPAGEQNTIANKKKGTALRGCPSACRSRHAPGGTHFCPQSRDRNSFPLVSPWGQNLALNRALRRKAARTLSAPNFPVCVPSIRTCRLDGTFCMGLVSVHSGVLHHDVLHLVGDLLAGVGALFQVGVDLLQASTSRMSSWVTCSSRILAMNSRSLSSSRELILMM